MSQVRDSPRRYKLGADGQPHRSWYGKLPEEFTPEDTLRFMAETDLQLNGTIETDTLAVIHAAGYDYQDGAIVHAYSAEVERLQNVAAAQERPSIKSQLEAGAKEVAKTDAAKTEAVNADVAKTDAAKESAAKAPKRKATKGAER